MVVESDRSECLSARVRFKELSNDNAQSSSNPPRTAPSRKSNRSSHGYHCSMRFPIQGKRIRLCFNGDRFAKPIAYSISAFKTYNAFLKDVNEKVGRQAALLYGARYIFNVDGVEIRSLEDMHHNSTYICASTTKFVPLNYDEVGVPKWHSALTKNAPLTRPSITRHKCTIKRKRQNSLPSENGDASMNARTEEIPNLPDTEIVEFLGRGHSAEVYKARNNRGNIFAAKVISMKDDNMREFVTREIGIMKLLHNEHIVKMFRTYEISSAGQVIELELMSGGDLFDYMKTNKILDEYNCASVVGCVASALTYMHSLSLVHRDIKPENLLVYFDENGLLRVKITDFGLATKVAKNQVLFTVCGTPTYVAPEIIAKEGYSYECDCWSTGIIMYLLLAGFPPFYTSNDDQYELFEQIVEANLSLDSDVLPEVSWSAKFIIRSLLLRSPRQRLKAKELMNEKWVKGPGLVTNADEDLAMLCLEQIESKLANEPRAPSLLVRNRRSSFQSLPENVAPGELHRSRTSPTVSSHKKNSLPVLYSQTKKSRMSSLASTSDSDSEDEGHFENGAGDFVFYRPSVEQKKQVC
ncbi:hypothetical protein M3Y94_00392000 [Aphelenchoides besseyi]|nr:hypothetical protein M3Y94_00392000 [Aphelenchoides besseyi]KAI6234990.1 Serine/threonine-protein kinase DCLK3 [Aphelenchoides besseyi]